jgi:hypothetical protein
LVVIVFFKQNTRGGYELSSKKFTRRELIKFVALGATIPFTWALINKAEASKALMKYQETPNGNEKCSNCMQFISGDTPDADGECKVVQGSISPQGWCTAYSQKP